MGDEPLTHCVKCGAIKNDGHECLTCGVIYAKSERVFREEQRALQELREQREQREQEEQAANREQEEQAKQQHASRPPTVIAFEYQDSGGRETSRQVKNPVRFFYEPHWYINGLCLMQKEARTFRIDRVQGELVDADTGEIITLDRLLEVNPPDHFNSNHRASYGAAQLMGCPVCENPISKNSKTCPHCGEPIAKENPLRGRKKQRAKKPLGCMGWAILVAFLLFMLGKCGQEQKQPTPVPTAPKEHYQPQAPPNAIKPPQPQHQQESGPEKYIPTRTDFSSTFVVALNSLYGQVCHAEINGFLSKTLKVEWTSSTKMIHSIKIIAEIGNAKEQLYQDGVRYFQFPNDIGTFNVIDWKTGEKKSISESSAYYFRK